MNYKHIQEVDFSKDFILPCKKDDLKSIEKFLPIKKPDFDGSFLSYQLIYGTNGNRIYLIGLGEEKNTSQIEACFQKLAFENSKNWENEIQFFAENLDAKAVQKAIIENGGNAEVFPVDLRNDAEIQSLIQFLQSKDRLDIVINNAGKSIRRPLTESLDRYHDFSRTMAINYEAPIKLMLALIPKLAKHNGHVVNVSAMNVLMAPAPYWAAYQASKSAFDQWVRSASPEMEYMGVHVSSVYLPLVRTRMIAPTKAYEKAPAMSPEHVAKIICRSLLKKKRTFKPWWSIFGEIGSVMFRRTWERSMRRQIRKKSH